MRIISWAKLSMRTIVLCFVVLGFLLGLRSASAELLSVANASFEDPVLEEDTWTDGYIPSWTISGTVETAGVFRPGPAFFPGGVPDGVNTAYSNGKSISQILQDVLTADMEYTLQVDLGKHQLDLPAYKVQLYAGNLLLAEDNNSLAPTDGQFLTATLSYTALSGNSNLGAALEIRLVDASGISWTQINWDNVRLDATAVPEPSTITLFTMAGLIGGFVAWRKRKIM
jgi:hypothetical protein